MHDGGCRLLHYSTTQFTTMSGANRRACEMPRDDTKIIFYQSHTSGQIVVLLQYQSKADPGLLYVSSLGIQNVQAALSTLRLASDVVRLKQIGANFTNREFWSLGTVTTPEAYHRLRNNFQ